MTRTQYHPYARITVSLDSRLLSHFYKIVPEGERSRKVAELIRRELEGTNPDLERLAWEFENHPDFEAVRRDTLAWDNVASDF